MSRVKKHKKDYTDFINTGNSSEDYDITRKSHKGCSDAHDDNIVARVQELVDTDPSKSMRAMARELEDSAIQILWLQKRSVHVLGEKIATVGENKEAPEPLHTHKQGGLASQQQ